MIGEFEQSESKTKILSTMSIMIERMERHVVPFAMKIANLIPPLWQAAENEHLVRPTIMVTLSKLVMVRR
jgi:hypothetical protein